MRRARLAFVAAALSAALSAAHAGGNTAWWSAFSDSTLDQLMHSAGAADTASEQALVAAYIVTRVDQTRVTLAARLLQAARDEEALLMDSEPSPQRNDALAALADRLQKIEDTAAAIAAERDRHAAELVRRSGVAEADLMRWLVPPDGHPKLPSVAQALPADAADDASRQLTEQAREALRQQQLLQARQLEMQAQQARQDAGSGDPLRALETYQQLVVDSDRYALASGQLALAWAQWLPARRGR